MVDKTSVTSNKGQAFSSAASPKAPSSPRAESGLALLAFVFFLFNAEDLAGAVVGVVGPLLTVLPAPTVDSLRGAGAPLALSTLRSGVSVLAPDFALATILFTPLGSFPLGLFSLFSLSPGVSSFTSSPMSLRSISWRATSSDPRTSSSCSRRACVAACACRASARLSSVSSRLASVALSSRVLTASSCCVRACSCRSSSNASTENWWAAFSPSSAFCTSKIRSRTCTS
mmetsp:Transcript_18034/g.31391  ORF Transcript_18034/g.31391 Transcript_18034/m.31391 type:complete len:229 (-) Transcript_18034:325-1011(-)